MRAKEPDRSRQPTASAQRRGEMNEQEAKKEIAQAKEELLEAKAKLKELNAKLMELSDVMEKIEAAQGRLQKVEEKLFIEGFRKKSSFDRINNGKD
jgi:DNA repair exonuclease SbcCD ATPase subunit